MKSINCEYIFNIGFNKSGTTSLTVALKNLGIKTVHYGFNKIILSDLLIHEYNTTNTIDLKKFPFKGYSDCMFIQNNFKLFDSLYPDSKFILTIRDKNQWINSWSQHNSQRYGKSRQIHVDVEEYSKYYDQHLEDVKNYFKDKPEKLLILNIFNDFDSYKKLCLFLNCPIQDAPFPHVNSHESFLRQKAINLIKKI